MLNTTLKKRILITGASGTVGSSIATHFRDREWEVFAVSNGGEIPVVGVTQMEKDLLAPGSGEELVEATKPHLLVNCAADQSVYPLYKPDLSGKTLDQVSKEMLRLNLIAPLELLTAAARVGTKVAVNISSVEAVRARPGHALYGASKAALESLTRGAALELAPMRVLAIRLGLISRPAIEQAWPEGVSAWNEMVPLKRMGDGIEVARVIESIASDDFQWATGTTIELDGGANSAPGW